MTTSRHAPELLAREERVPIGDDSDIGGSFVAIKRAAASARLIAAQTGTDLIVVRSGRLVRVSPDQNLKR